jgi:hypothetical protein
VVGESAGAGALLSRPVAGADLTRSDDSGVLSDGALPVKFDGVYANETRDPAGCEEQAVKSCVENSAPIDRQCFTPALRWHCCSSW